MRRRIAVVGDILSTSGRVVEYPPVKSVGQIIKAGGMNRRFLKDREIALDGDLVVCKCAERHVLVPLFQFEYDAAVSIVFNSGANDGADELVKKLNVGRYDDMFSSILSYRVGSNPGLPPRRYSEARLFASGVYDASH